MTWSWGLEIVSTLATEAVASILFFSCLRPGESFGDQALGTDMAVSTTDPYALGGTEAGGDAS